ncbi:ABC transporter substrate-binding protein [Patulibacter sp. S7RM1-6]
MALPTPTAAHASAAALDPLTPAELAAVAAATRAADPEWAAIVAEITRRRFLVGAVGAGLTLGVAACGGDDGGAPTTTDATRVVQSADGPVRVPAQPRRIVTVNPYPFGTLVDLGVRAAGTLDEGEEYVTKPNLARWKATPKVNRTSDIDLEKVAALRPDLIIGIDNASYIASVLPKLRRIAPTVLLPFGEDATWQEWSRGTADAVGRGDALEGLRRRYRTRVAEIRTRHADVLARTRFDVLQGGFDEGQCWVYGRRSPIGQILADAGVRFATASARASSTDVDELSYERLSALRDADAIAYYVTRDGAPANEGPALFAQRAWKRLPAARAGALLPFTEFLPGSYGDALAALDELEAGLRRLEADAG